MALGPYGWFGSPPGSRMQSLEEFRKAKHTRGDSLGVKKERVQSHIVEYRLFEWLEDINALIARLFGQVSEIGSQALSMAHGKCRCRTLGEVRTNQVPRPLVRVQRINSPSSYLQLCNLLQSLATAPLVGPSRSMRRSKAPPSASMPKDRRRTCAWSLEGCTTFTALLHDKFLRPTPASRHPPRHVRRVEERT